MPDSVEGLIVVTRGCSVGFGWDDDDLPCCSQRFNYPFIGIKGLIGDDRVRVNAGKQSIGSVKIMRLSRRQMKPGRVAQHIAGGVDYVVVKPPLLRPMASYADGPLLPQHCADGREQWWNRSSHIHYRDHRQTFEYPFPDTALPPARMPCVDHPEIPEPLRHIPPRNPCAIPIQNRFDKQPVILHHHPHHAFTPRQLSRDLLPLVIPQSVPPHHPQPLLRPVNE